MELLLGEEFMAHFAKLDENNNVLAVHVINNDVIMVDGNELEQAGIDFLTSLHGHSLWKQTSYNTYGGIHTNGNIPLRKNYAAPGYIYDEIRDAFIPPKPFNSWILNEETCLWDAPTPYPIDDEDGKVYRWIEEDLNWQPIMP